jgi:hypothetical protein
VTQTNESTVARNLKERWEAERLRGQFPRSLGEGLIGMEESYRWLKFADIKRETESTIMLAQDQAISTNYFEKKILKQGTESKCRLYKEYEGTIDHLISGCPTVAKIGYIMRHDEVCTPAFLNLQEIRH